MIEESPTNSEKSVTAVSTQRQYYAETAARYDQMHLMDREHNEALEHIQAVMGQRSLHSILDVGCGTGRGVKFLLDRGFDAVGVEPVTELLQQGCRTHGLPAERMLEGNGECLAFDDNHFDASVELGVLHHVPKPAEVVAEMIRVSKHAIFISDCNRFGQGRFAARLIKLAAYHLGMWKPIDLIRTRGKGYTISDEDGLAYSYSVYDSFSQLAEWADRIHVVPTLETTSHSWFHPLLTCSHVLLVAIRNGGPDES